MSIWLLVLYALAMSMLVLNGTAPAALFQTVAVAALTAFSVAILKFGIRKPVV